MSLQEDQRSAARALETCDSGRSAAVFCRRIAPFARGVGGSRDLLAKFTLGGGPRPVELANSGAWESRRVWGGHRPAKSCSSQSKLFSEGGSVRKTTSNEVQTGPNMTSIGRIPETAQLLDRSLGGGDRSFLRDIRITTLSGQLPVSFLLVGDVEGTFCGTFFRFQQAVATGRACQLLEPKCIRGGRFAPKVGNRIVSQTMPLGQFFWQVPYLCLKDLHFWWGIYQAKVFGGFWQKLKVSVRVP